MLSLLRLERKQNNYSKPFRIRIFLFLSYSSGIETISTFIHSVVLSKTIPDSRPTWAKRIPVFGPKRAKNPTRWGGTNLYGLYKGVPPPPPPPWRCCCCNYCYYYMYCCYCVLYLLLPCCYYHLLLLLLPLLLQWLLILTITTSASACYATGDLKVTLQ